MKLNASFLRGGLALAGAFVIRRLINSLDVRVDWSACGPQPTDPRQQRYLYNFWHESILMAAGFRTRVYALISQHADGDVATRICRHLGFQVVRGSTTRGGAAGLWDLLATAQHAHLALTPDGPKGPRRRLQPGTVFLASKTGLPILPVGVGFANAWRMKSWDHFAVPKPFSRVTCVGAQPIVVPQNLGIRDLEYFRSLVEQRLLEATSEAEAWASDNRKRSRTRLAA